LMKLWDSLLRLSNFLPSKLNKCIFWPPFAQKILFTTGNEQRNVPLNPHPVFILDITRQQFTCWIWHIYMPSLLN